MVGVHNWAGRRASTLILVIVIAVLATVASSWVVGETGAGAVGAASSPRPTAAIDPGTDPLADASPVYAIVEANGRYYIGGDFQNVAGETQPYLAAIEVATGRLDQTWRPDVNGIVQSIAVSPDGSAVYVGGKFTRIDNSYPSRIAKLDPTTGAVDPNFDPDASAAVEALVTDGTTIWAGGAFTTIGGVAQPHLAKLDTSGNVDTSFDPVLNAKILDLELVGFELYLGGNFTSIDGVTHERIAAVDPLTGIASSWAPSSAFKVYDVSVKPDGSILYAAGAGSLGAGGNSLTAWDTTTGALLWRRVNSGDFQAVVATDDLVYIGTHGNFVYIDNNGPFLESDANPNAVRRDKLAAFDPITGALDEWNPGADSTWGVWSLGLGPSGLLVGGDFVRIGDVIQPHFAVFPGPSVGNVSPRPSFTYDCDGGSCTFDASGSFDPDGTIVSYDWHFFTGGTATGETTSFNFSTDLALPISLTVTDNNGETARTENVLILGDGELNVELIGTGTANGQSAVVSPVLPDGIEDGDLAVAVVSVNDSAAITTPPAGWTLVGSQVAGSMTSQVYTSPVGLADAGATVPFTFDQSWKSDASIVVFRYADTTTPVAAFASEPESTLWGQHSAPSLSSAVPSTIMHYWANRSGDGVSLAAPGDEAVIVQSVGELGAHINATISLSTAETPGAAPERVAIGDKQTKSALGWTIAITELPQVPTCTAVLQADDTVALSWTEVRRANSYTVRSNENFVASNGLATSYVDDPGPGTYDYTIRVRLRGAVQFDISCSPQVTVDDPPPFVQTCSAVLNADDSVTMTWDAIPNENAYSIRRNNQYVDFAGNTTSFTDSPGGGTWDYVVRSRMNGITTDTPCTPTITIMVAAQTCSAVLNADDSVTLTWDEIVGENGYSIRRNDSYVDFVNTLTYADSPGAGTWDYVIRSSKAGVTTNTTCTPTITITTAAQNCTAVLNADDSITLSWDAIAGEDSYQVRRNEAWLETTSALTYTDVFADDDDEYVIRSRKAGVTTDTPCS